MLPNSIGVPEAAAALTWNPLPGVENTTPRGELTLKKFAGRLLGADNESGTPSQLISRLPELKVPATFAFSVPRLVRNASTEVWIEAALTPLAEVTTGTAWATVNVDTSTAEAMRRGVFMKVLVKSALTLLRAMCSAFRGDQQSLRRGAAGTTVRPSTAYTQAIKRKMLREAGVSESESIKYELDHFVPLALGGHPRKLENVWLQRWDGPWNARVKDRLEHALQLKVCSGHMELDTARDA